MFRFLHNYKAKRKWIKEGKPMKKYEGSHCGCCGKWIAKPFEVPLWEANEFADGWGLCNSCSGGNIDR